MKVGLTLLLMASLLTLDGRPQTPKLPTYQRVRASYYADKFENRPMAGGGRFHQSVPVAATVNYPLGTLLYVHNAVENKSIILRCQDRGPYSKKYGIDLSKAAWKMLNLDSPESLKTGGWVEIERLD